MKSSTEFLTQSQITEQLAYLSNLNDEKVDIDNPHEIRLAIEKISAIGGYMTFVLASAKVNYGEKKTPISVALKDWSVELSDKLNKRLSGLQTNYNGVKEEIKASRWQEG